MNEVLEGFRLSSQQQRLWELQKEGKGYRTSTAVGIAGGLRVGVLRAALQEIVQEYEILRTSFRTLPGVDVVLQVIQDSADTALAEESLAGMSRPEQKR